jgi:hypothetical protein
MAEASLMTSPSADRFARAFDQATVVVVAVWQIGAAGTALLVYLGSYAVPLIAACAWLLQLAVIIAASVPLLQRCVDSRMTWVLLAVDLAAGVMVVAVSPPREIFRLDWAYTTVGMIGVLLLLHGPVRRLLVFLAVNAGTVLAALVIGGSADRHHLSGFVTVFYASASIQLAMMAAARVFDFTAQGATDVAAEEAETATREAVIAQVVRARRARYQAAREVVVPILRGLADGTVDPADPIARHRCATAEAMLRQLMTRQDDLPHPLLRLLQHGIDSATRRGAVVDVAAVGPLPSVPPEVGTALTEPSLSVLAGARSYARITVVQIGPDEVTISVLADGTAPAEVGPAVGFSAGGVLRGDVTIATDRDGDLFWLEARWRRP